MASLFKPAVATSKNPLTEDPVLKKLLDEITDIPDELQFRRWKDDFLQQFDTYLHPGASQNADRAFKEFSTGVVSLAKDVRRLEKFREQGDLTMDRCSVKARRCLGDFQSRINRITIMMADLVPPTQEEERKAGFTKFNLGAILVRDGFVEYDRLEKIQLHLKMLRNGGLDEILDRSTGIAIDKYGKAFEQLLDILADLGLHQVMEQCTQFIKGEWAPSSPSRRKSDEKQIMAMQQALMAEQTKELELPNLQTDDDDEAVKINVLEIEDDSETSEDTAPETISPTSSCGYSGDDGIRVRGEGNNADEEKPKTRQISRSMSLSHTASRIRDKPDDVQRSMKLSSSGTFEFTINGVSEWRGIKNDDFKNNNGVKHDNKSNVVQRSKSVGPAARSRALLDTDTDSPVKPPKRTNSMEMVQRRARSKSVGPADRRRGISESSIVSPKQRKTPTPGRLRPSDAMTVSPKKRTATPRRARSMDAMPLQQHVHRRQTPAKTRSSNDPLRSSSHSISSASSNSVRGSKKTNNGGQSILNNDPSGKSSSNSVSSLDNVRTGKQLSPGKLAKGQPSSVKRSHELQQPTMKLVPSKNQPIDTELNKPTMKIERDPPKDEPGELSKAAPKKTQRQLTQQPIMKLISSTRSKTKGEVNKPTMQSKNQKEHSNEPSSPKRRNKSSEDGSVGSGRSLLSDRSIRKKKPTESPTPSKLARSKSTNMAPASNDKPRAKSTGRAVQPKVDKIGPQNIFGAILGAIQNPKMENQSPVAVQRKPGSPKTRDDESQRSSVNKPKADKINPQNISGALPNPKMENQSHTLVQRNPDSPKAKDDEAQSSRRSWTPFRRQPVDKAPDDRRAPDSKSKSNKGKGEPDVDKASDLNAKPEKEKGEADRGRGRHAEPDVRARGRSKTPAPSKRGSLSNQSGKDENDFQKPSSKARSNREQSRQENVPNHDSQPKKNKEKDVDDVKTKPNREHSRQDNSPDSNKQPKKNKEEERDDPKTKSNDPKARPKKEQSRQESAPENNKQQKQSKEEAPDDPKRSANHKPSQDEEPEQPTYPQAKPDKNGNCPCCGQKWPLWKRLFSK